jgi:hypothetical protein
LFLASRPRFVHFYFRLNPPDPGFQKSRPPLPAMHTDVRAPAFAGKGRKKIYWRIMAQRRAGFVLKILIA